MNPIAQVTCHRYFLFGWPVPAVIVLAPLAISAVYVWLAMKETGAAVFWLCFLAPSLAAFVYAYFWLPVFLYLNEEKVGIRFLLGPTVWYKRSNARFELGGFGGLLRVSVVSEGFAGYFSHPYVFNIIWFRRVRDLLEELKLA